MDTPLWTPIRWPCGPLEIERGMRRTSFTADERAVLEQWRAPGALERLGGTPFNCLVVAWADGSPSDDSQQRSLAPLISAARGAGLAVVGEVGEDADLRKAAAAADSAGLRALATESTESLDGFPVLRFGEPSVADRSPRPFLGVSGLPWPGLKVNLDDDTDASSGPTGPPWIDSNAWFVRLARELIRPETTWLSFEPPEDGLRDPGAAYVQAVADAEVYGARWVVSLDAGVRLRPGRGTRPGTGDVAPGRPGPRALRGAPVVGQLSSCRPARSGVRLLRAERVHVLRGAEPPVSATAASTASSRARQDPVPVTAGA